MFNNENNYTNLKELSKNNIGEKFNFIGKVEIIKQTSGPTLMIINDGTSNFTFKAFLKPGVRAYDNINEGDYVKGIAIVYERNNEIEGEIIDLKKLSNEEKELFYKKFNENIDSICLPENPKFSIKSDKLKKFYDLFLNTATLIRKAIIENRPILIRHNADCDGYVSAITVEKAILEFMKEKFPGDNHIEYLNYRRAPSKAPFYEYDDAIKDLTLHLINKNKNNSKPPLIIIMDNGSTEEDILAIKQMKMFGSKIIVVDHHYPGEIRDGKAEVDNYVDIHINPYLKGFDSNLTAGMLGFELSRFIKEDLSLSFLLPALSGIADHSDGEELNRYLELAKNEGYNREYIEKLVETIDCLIYHIRFSESRELVQEIFFNSDNQQKFINILYDTINESYKKKVPIFEKFVEIIDLKNIYLVLLNGEKTLFRSEYPSIGKTINFMQKYYEKKVNRPIISMVYGTNFGSIRVSDSINSFSVPEFVKYLRKKYPEFNISGGGHEHAGSIKFIGYCEAEIKKLLLEYLHKI